MSGPVVATSRRGRQCAMGCLLPREARAHDRAAATMTISSLGAVPARAGTTHSQRMETGDMSSQIDPTKPEEGVPAVKSDLRANLQAAKTEIEALQDGKVAVGQERHRITVLWQGTQAEYDAIAEPDATTLYVVKSDAE